MIINKLKPIVIAALLATTTYSSASQDGTIKLVHTNKVHNRAISSYSNIDAKIIELADSLLASSRIPQTDMGNIAITSFVDLDQLNKTTHFGRTLAETFFNELFIRGFNITDFRGQNALSINNTGEFFITRDVTKLNKKITNKYILVGTYSKLEDAILINARIMNNETGNIVASAKSYFFTKDCKLLENCRKPRTISIISDNCSKVRCPSNCKKIFIKR